MKETYRELEIELIYYETEDIITDSNDIELPEISVPDNSTAQ
ncbi:MAG: hypothetical protein Q4A32_09595 [Lachnospiraceae bacterium]|nr:hypothetical protein [Lachnospiraceae bacterium]